MIFSYLHEFHGDQFESLLLEPSDDGTNQSPLNAIRLNNYQGLWEIKYSNGIQYTLGLSATVDLATSAPATDLRQC